MFQCKLNADHCYDTVGTLDIETSGFDGAKDHLVAVGVGYHDTSNGDDAEVEVHTQRKCDGDERELIRSAFQWLNDRDPEALVSYKGSSFDMDFLYKKHIALKMSDLPTLECTRNHIDLFDPRKDLADQNGKKWPSLEESLAAYEIPDYVTEWNGGTLTNTRFGEELAPRYVSALQNGDNGMLDELESVVVEYTESDIEANLALYAADAGREYLPTYAQ